MHIKTKLLIVFVFNLIYLKNYSQEISISGKIVDSTGVSLVNANILAFPELEDVDASFAISDEKGNYNLKLKSSIKYIIDVSYLGYNKVSFEIYPTKDTSKNITLSPYVNQLEEVLLSYKIPVQVKKDTVIYNTDAFVSGKEVKLRDVLKKLPGMEVDRDGNVLAFGKKITKVLIEDEIFFSGDSKLAVNNIPADAIDKVTILDNYTEIDFLKGLIETDEVAMNVVLKEDKKNFVFGDVDAGRGVKHEYLLHSNIFYYSPKTNINSIIDFNNIGVKSFALSDYIDFEGGFGKLMENVNASNSFLNESLPSFISDAFSVKDKRSFGAINFKTDISNGLKLNSYVISGINSSENRVEATNTFLSDNYSFIENRNNNSDSDKIFSLGKITLESYSKGNKNFKINSFFNASNDIINGNLISNNPKGSANFITNSNNKSVVLKQNIGYSKKANEHQTYTIESTLKYSRSQPFKKFRTTQPLLEQYLSTENFDFFSMTQNQNVKNLSFDVIYKNYWILNNYNHIYTSIGSNIVFENFNSTTEPEISYNNSINSANFINEIHYLLQDNFLGNEYKFLRGIFTVKFGLFYHHYFLRNSQMSLNAFNKVQMFTPKLNFEVDLKKRSKVDFSYKYDVRFPKSYMLAENLIIRNFNSIFKGDNNLEEEYFHTSSLNYSNFNLVRETNFNAHFLYIKKTQSIKNQYELNGINQFINAINFYQPENGISSKIRFSKRMENIKFFIQNKSSYNEYIQLVNHKKSLNISKKISLGGKIDTYFNKWPNFELSYTHELSNYSSDNFNATFTKSVYFSKLNYVFLKNFNLAFDYEIQNYFNESRTITNNFNTANLELFYQKEDSRWKYVVTGTNLLNRKFLRSNSLNDFILIDSKNYLLPRLVVFKVSYKL